MPKNHISRLLISGGGIGGLTAAIAFARQGVAVEIVEKRKEHSAIGVGIIQNANALRVLKGLGLLDKVLAAGFQMDERRFCLHDGTTLCAADALRTLDPNLPAINNITRQALHDILTEAAKDAGVTIRLGETIAELEQTSKEVRVRFANATEGVYDLLIGADGIRSDLRDRLFGHDRGPRFVGYGFWRLTTRRFKELNYIGVYQGLNGSKAGLVPLSEDLMYMFLVTAEPGNPFYEENAKYSTLKTWMEGYEGPVGDIRDAMKPNDYIAYSPAEQVELPSPWYRGRVVLIGDASHAILPHLAQGAAMAMEDAVVLAELAQSTDNVADMLKSFMDRRYERCMFAQKASRASADSQQDHTPEQLSAHLEKMKDLLPTIWRNTDLKLAEAI